MKLTHGTTEQCLAHLKKTIAGRDFLDKRKVIADFAGVDETAVRRWFKENKLPVGEALIRLRFYLEFLGYEVAEIGMLQQPVRDAARLYAFRIATLSEIAEMVGYGGKARNAIDTMIGVFRGAQGVSTQKLEQFCSFIELYGVELEKKQKNTAKVFSSKSQALTHTEVVRPQLRTIGESHSTIIDALAASVRAMLPLAEHALSDGFTAEERQRVRNLAGDGVSRLSFLLTKLSGEAVRNALTKQQ